MSAPPPWRERTPEQFLAMMTVEEKVGQLSLYSADVHWDGNPVNPVLSFGSPAKRIDDIRAGRVTGIFNAHGEDQLRPLQRVAVEESRLGIPLIFGADVIHGFQTIFPVPLAEAASFEPDMAERVAESVAGEAAAAGIHWTFAPGADVCRDARWGRALETAGEDPVLASRFAAARVRGFQGRNLRDPRRLMATVKHFAGYGAAEAGLDYDRADIPASTLNDAYLPPYHAAVAAGAGAVMTAFNTVEGVPATANRNLLSDILRDRWKFPGFTVSDYNSDREVIVHGVADTPREAARLCFLAGLDMCMESGLYAEELPALVQSGVVAEALLDAAVLRVLKAKAALGLFDHPYRGFAGPPPVAIRPLALDMARRCPVLIKNPEGVLPLRSGQRVALIGPFAREHGHLNGAWAIFGDNRQSVDLETGLHADPGIGTLLVEPGCDIDKPIEGGIAAARDAATRSDVILLALGEGQHMSGESRSRANPVVPAPQIELARALRELGKPIVTLLRTGRPLVIPDLLELSDALLVVWFLGSETGHAVADLVTGRIAPSGRLPMTFPRHVGQIPIYYARDRTGRPPSPHTGMFTARYIDIEPGPLLPFGFGLGYGAAGYCPTRVDCDILEWDGHITASCSIEETLGREIEEVVQLYVHDIAASRVRPPRELKDFRKIAIPAHGRVEVSFRIDRAMLAFDHGAGTYEAESGMFEIWIAPHAHGGDPARFSLARQIA